MRREPKEGRLIAVVYVVCDDWWHLAASIRSFKAAGKVFVFVSSSAWDGTAGDCERCAMIAAAEGAVVIRGNWPDEQLHRRAALAHAKGLGYKFAITPDSDELADPELLEALVKVAKADLADRVYVQMSTFWKTPCYIIRPREQLEPLIMLNLRKVEHVHIREYKGGRKLLLDADQGVINHLSYVGPDERIKRKTESWGHRSEVVPGWWRNIWLAWDRNKLLANLHPTHPPCFGYAERVPVPKVLAQFGVEEPGHCVASFQSTGRQSLS